MKSCAGELKVMFLSVIIPLGRCVVGSSTGSIFIEPRVVENLNTEAGTTARKRPVAASLIFIWWSST